MLQIIMGVCPKMGLSLCRGGRDSIRGEKRIWALEGPPLEDIVDIEESLAPLNITNDPQCEIIPISLQHHKREAIITVIVKRRCTMPRATIPKATQSARNPPPMCAHRRRQSVSAPGFSRQKSVVLLRSCPLDGKQEGNECY